MAYTQKQVREVVGLTPETIRIWRQALPPLMLAERQGPGRFSFGDLLALAILKSAVDEFDARISRFRDVASRLFDMCQLINVARPPWALSLSRESADMLALPTALMHVRQPSILIPLAPIIGHLQTKAEAENAPPDQQFLLPLIAPTK